LPAIVLSYFKQKMPEDESDEVSLAFSLTVIHSARDILVDRVFTSFGGDDSG
jgi:hypothetical protein